MEAYSGPEGLTGQNKQRVSTLRHFEDPAICARESLAQEAVTWEESYGDKDAASIRVAAVHKKVQEHILALARPSGPICGWFPRRQPGHTDAKDVNRLPTTSPPPSPSHADDAHFIITTSCIPVQQHASSQAPVAGLPASNQPAHLSSVVLPTLYDRIAASQEEEPPQPATLARHQAQPGINQPMMAAPLTSTFPALAADGASRGGAPSSPEQAVFSAGAAAEAAGGGAPSLTGYRPVRAARPTRRAAAIKQSRGSTDMSHLLDRRQSSADMLANILASLEIRSLAPVARGRAENTHQPAACVPVDNFPTPQLHVNVPGACISREESLQGDADDLGSAIKELERDSEGLEWESCASEPSWWTDGEDTEWVAHFRRRTLLEACPLLGATYVARVPQTLDPTSECMAALSTDASFGGAYCTASSSVENTAELPESSVGSKPTLCGRILGGPTPLPKIPGSSLSSSISELDSSETSTADSHSKSSSPDLESGTSSSESLKADSSVVDSSEVDSSEVDSSEVDSSETSSSASEWSFEDSVLGEVPAFLNEPPYVQLEESESQDVVSDLLVFEAYNAEEEHPSSPGSASSLALLSASSLALHNLQFAPCPCDLIRGNHLGDTLDYQPLPTYSGAIDSSATGQAAASNGNLPGAATGAASLSLPRPIAAWQEAQPLLDSSAQFPSGLSAEEDAAFSHETKRPRVRRFPSPIPLDSSDTMRPSLAPIPLGSISGGGATPRSDILEGVSGGRPSPCYVDLEESLDQGSVRGPVSVAESALAADIAEADTFKSDGINNLAPMEHLLSPAYQVDAGNPGIGLSTSKSLAALPHDALMRFWPSAPASSAQETAAAADQDLDWASAPSKQGSKEGPVIDNQEPQHVGDVLRSDRERQVSAAVARAPSLLLHFHRLGLQGSDASSASEQGFEHALENEVGEGVSTAGGQGFEHALGHELGEKVSSAGEPRSAASTAADVAACGADEHTPSDSRVCACLGVHLADRDHQTPLLEQGQPAAEGEDAPPSWDKLLLAKSPAKEHQTSLLEQVQPAAEEEDAPPSWGELLLMKSPANFLAPDPTEGEGAALKAEHLRDEPLYIEPLLRSRSQRNIAAPSSSSIPESMWTAGSPRGSRDAGFCGAGEKGDGFGTAADQSFDAREGAEEVGRAEDSADGGLWELRGEGQWTLESVYESAGAACAAPQELQKEGFCVRAVTECGTTRATAVESSRASEPELEPLGRNAWAMWQAEGNIESCVQSGLQPGIRPARSYSDGLLKFVSLHINIDDDGLSVRAASDATIVSLPESFASDGADESWEVL